MKLALDTNRAVDLFRGERSAVHQLESGDGICLPLIVLGELKAGFYGGDRRAANEILLQKFLSHPAVELLCPGRETAEIYGRLFVQLRRAGTPVPDNDLWIAALVLEHGLTLMTRDRHFDRIPQLPLLV